MQLQEPLTVTLEADPLHCWDDKSTASVLRALVGLHSTGLSLRETAVKIGTEQHWLYGAIDVETKLILDVALFGRRGTNPAAAFLHGLAQKHDLSDAEFLVDGAGYLTALSRLGLSSHLDYVDRNHIEKWFHTLKMRIDRFHNSWVGSRASASEWLEQFVHYYNTQRPHQSLNKQPPAEVLN